MIPFKKITSSEKTAIRSFLDSSTDEATRQSLHCWVEANDTYYAIVEGQIVFRQQGEHIFNYSMPAGNGLLRLALIRMIEDGAVMGCKCKIKGIMPERKADIDSAMPGHFSFEEENDGTVTAIAIRHYSNSVFNNNEGMVPPPTGEMFKSIK